MRTTFLFLLTALGAVAQHNETPGALLGEWMTGKTSSSITFQDRATGANSGPSGTWVQYRFLPNGRYEYAALTQQSMYNCSTKLLTFKTGIVAYQADVLTFIPQDGKFTSSDNCNRQYNYEKPIDKSRETFRWHVEQDQYGVKMCLQNEKINGCAYKK